MATLSNTKLIATKIRISLEIEVSRISRRAFAPIFTKVSKMGMTTGKPNIAIRVALFCALAEIAETKVKAIDSPILPRNIAKTNNPVSLTGFPVSKLSAAQLRRLSTNNSVVL